MSERQIPNYYTGLPGEKGAVVFLDNEGMFERKKSSIGKKDLSYQNPNREESVLLTDEELVHAGVAEIDEKMAAMEDSYESGKSIDRRVLNELRDVKGFLVDAAVHSPEGVNSYLGGERDSLKSKGKLQAAEVAEIARSHFWDVKSRADHATSPNPVLGGQPDRRVGVHDFITDHNSRVHELKRREALKSKSRN